jgi:ribonucleotide reductase beta subunit family protein with ferritin-like domain
VECRPRAPLLFAMMAFAEGVMFSGMFAMLEWLKTRNMFPGVTQLNEFIVRDEGLHAEFWVFVVNEQLEERLAPELVAEIADIMVGLSAEFFAEFVPRPVHDISAPLLAEYVGFVARNVERQLGGTRPPLTNPLPYMDKSALNSVMKSSFFEHDPTTYQEIGCEGAMSFKLNVSDRVDDDSD